MRILCLLIVAVMLAGCDKPQDSNSTAPARAGGKSSAKVTLLLNWFPEAEHGGYYAALVNKRFEQEGLDVEIVPGGVDIKVEALVDSGKYDFGVTNADNIVFARAAGADIAALMAPMQISPRCIMVHESAGIDSLADLKDMTLAMNDTGAFVAYIRANYPLKNIRQVPYPGSIAVFLNDKNFAQQAYNISEPFTARQNGGDPKVLMLSDAGFNPYTSCLVASDAFLEKNAGTARGMVRACVLGWRDYMESPAAINAYIHGQNPEMSVDALAFGAAEMKPMVYTADVDTKNIGAMTPERWSTLVEQMGTLKLIKAGDVQSRECFTTEYLAD